MFCSIIMARRALFPETILDADQETLGETCDDEVEPKLNDENEEINALLAALSGWKHDNSMSDDKSLISSDSQPSSFIDALTEELQAWRKEHEVTPYDDWGPEKKKEFTVSSNEKIL
jgi:hypothetical protein